MKKLMIAGIFVFNFFSSSNIVNAITWRTVPFTYDTPGWSVLADTSAIPGNAAFAVPVTFNLKRYNSDGLVYARASINLTQEMIDAGNPIKLSVDSNNDVILKNSTTEVELARATPTWTVFLTHELSSTTFASASPSLVPKGSRLVAAGIPQKSISSPLAVTLENNQPVEFVVEVATRNQPPSVPTPTARIKKNGVFVNSLRFTITPADIMSATGNTLNITADLNQCTVSVAYPDRFGNKFSLTKAWVLQNWIYEAPEG